jgi:hypothetical protein
MEKMLLDRVNRTELYQLCRRSGVPALPNMNRKELVECIVNGAGDLGIHPVDEWRRAIMRFVLGQWKRMQTQLTCPAASGDENACFQCEDVQVLSCVAQNAHAQHKLEEYKKQEDAVGLVDDMRAKAGPTKREKPTYENAPRTKEGIDEYSRFEMRDLAYALNIIDRADPDSAAEFDGRQKDEKVDILHQAITLMDKKRDEDEGRSKKQPVKRKKGKKRQAQEEAAAPEETATSEEAEQVDSSTRQTLTTTHAVIDPELKSQIEDIVSSQASMTSDVNLVKKQLVTVVRLCKALLAIQSVELEHTMGGTAKEWVGEAFEYGAKIDIPPNPGKGQ